MFIKNNRFQPLIRNMRVNLSCRNICVSQKILNQLISAPELTKYSTTSHSHSSDAIYNGDCPSSSHKLINAPELSKHLTTSHYPLYNFYLFFIFFFLFFWADMTFILRPIWLGGDLTWVRFELGPIWLEPIWLGADLTGNRLD
jgi:hypothetical protein